MDRHGTGQLCKAVLDAFSQKTGAKVRYTSGGNDLAVLLNSRVAGGSPPDVAFIPQPGVVKEFINRGAIKEVTGAAAAAISANYSEAWRQASHRQRQALRRLLQGGEQVDDLVSHR